MFKWAISIPMLLVAFLAGALVWMTIAWNLDLRSTSRATVSVLNKSSGAIAEIELRVCGLEFRLADLPSGATARLEYDIGCSSERYQPRVRYADGRVIEHEVGYVVVGHPQIIEILDGSMFLK